MSGDPWTWTERFSRTDRPSARCNCGPDSTGEAPDERPDYPVHGEDALPSGLAAGQDDPGTLRKVAELSARLREQYGEQP